MNLTKKLFLRKCQFPLAIALGFFPIPIVVNAGFVPELVSVCWIFPLIYAVMAIACMAVPGKIRVLVGFAGVGLLCVPAVFFPNPVMFWVALGEGLFYGIILLCSLTVAKWTETDELAPGITWMGMGLHLGAQLLIFICDIYDFHQMDGTEVWLLPTMLTYVLLAMLSMNRRGLYSASTGRQTVPTAMRRKNSLMVLALFAGAALLAALPAVGEFVKNMLATIGGLIMMLLLLLEPKSEKGEPTQPSSSTAGDKIDLGAEAVDNPIMETLFAILANAVMIAAIVIVVIFLWRKGRQWLPKLWKRFSKHLAASSEDYVDEITSTREFGVQEKHKEKGEKVSRLRQRSLPPRQQIRSRYRTVLQKHPEWAAGSTAREKLSDTAAPLYERARYSDHDITEEEAKKFREDTKKV